MRVDSTLDRVRHRGILEHDVGLTVFHYYTPVNPSGSLEFIIAQENADTTSATETQT